MIAWVAASLPGTTAHAGVITVTVRTQTGAAAEDAVLVFDPLDDKPSPGHAAAVIDQVNRRFEPHVSVVRTGTSVTFPNSDSIRHQVYSFSQVHPFTLKLYAGSPRAEVVFDKPGLVVLGCNIHDTMVAFVAVVDSPYFAKVPASGSIELSLPPGRYRLRAWHPKLDVAFEARQITVGSAPLNLPLNVALNSASETAAAWPE